MAACRVAPTPRARVEAVREIVAAEFFAPERIAWSAPAAAVSTHAEATARIRADLASHTSSWLSEDPERHDLAGPAALRARRELHGTCR